MVELASVKMIVIEMSWGVWRHGRCNKIPWFCAFLFCNTTFTWFIPSKQCSTKCTFLKEDKYFFFFFLPVVDSLSFCALDASLLLFGQTFTSSNYDNIECQGILPQIFIKKNKLWNWKQYVCCYNLILMLIVLTKHRDLEFHWINWKLSVR